MKVQKEFIASALAWRLWTKFGWQDLLARYRRSWLGPIWLIMTMIVLVSALSFVYGALFNQPMEEYLPFVALGLACWSFLSAVAGEGTTTFVESETFIRQCRVSLFIYVLRVFWRNVLVFLHHFAVALVVIVLFGKFSFALLPLGLLGLMLLLAQGLWVIPLLALIGTRFRDLQPIVSNGLQLLFFLTPVMWMPSALGGRRWIADLNPLTSLLAVVREPFLGAVPPLTDYVCLAVISVAGCITAVWFYGRFQSRVVYWL